MTERLEVRRRGAPPVRVGIHLGYWQSGVPSGLPATLADLESLGVDSFWTSEAYGADAFTPLAWASGITTRARLGTSIAGIFGRSPATTAMSALTLDHLSGGRAVLGLGVSGPVVAERWHGARFTRPLAHMRDYVRAVRQVLAGGRLEQASGLSGTPSGSRGLKSSLRPWRPEIPVLIGAEGPRNVALAAEVGDGWIATHYDPCDISAHARALEAGLHRRPEPAVGFEVVVRVPVSVAPTLEAASRPIQERIAREIGLMGTDNAYFHREAFVRLGFAKECAEIAEAYEANVWDGAAALVTPAMVDAVALAGPVSRVCERLARYCNGQVSTVVLSGEPASLREVARALREAQDGARDNRQEATQW
jgi:F420-dependent oxidoreductase-like protein